MYRKSESFLVCIQLILCKSTVRNFNAIPTLFRYCLPHSHSSNPTPFQKTTHQLTPPPSALSARFHRSQSFSLVRSTIYKTQLRFSLIDYDLSLGYFILYDLNVECVWKRSWRCIRVYVCIYIRSYDVHMYSCIYVYTYVGTLILCRMYYLKRFTLLLFFFICISFFLFVSLFLFSFFNDQWKSLISYLIFTYESMIATRCTYDRFTLTKKEKKPLTNIFIIKKKRIFLFKQKFVIWSPYNTMNERQLTDNDYFI